MGLNANAPVKHRHGHHAIPAQQCRQADRLKVGRVFTGIDQEVGKSLCEPHCIAHEHDGLRRQLDQQAVLVAVEHRVRDFSGAMDDVGKHQGDLFQSDFAGADARGVKQVLKQALHVGDLARDDLLDVAELR